MAKFKWLLFFLCLFYEISLSQAINPSQSFERGLPDKKSPFLPDNYVSFMIQGNLNFESFAEGYNNPNSNYIDNSSLYLLRSNSNNLLRITARLDQDMPPGAHLKLFMSPPRGAYATERILTSIDQNLLTNISKGDHNEPITYTFRYDAATTSQQISRRIIFTVHEN